MKIMKENTSQSFQFTQPQPAAEPVELGPLLDEISAAIRLHVVLSAHAATALALWVVHTYVFDTRDAVAYVAIESPELNLFLCWRAGPGRNGLKGRPRRRYS